MGDGDYPPSTSVAIVAMSAASVLLSGVYVISKARPMAPRWLAGLTVYQPPSDAVFQQMVRAADRRRELRKKLAADARARAAAGLPPSAPLPEPRKRKHNRAQTNTHTGNTRAHSSSGAHSDAHAHANSVSHADPDAEAAAAFEAEGMQVDLHVMDVRAEHIARMPFCDDLEQLLRLVVAIGIALAGVVAWGMYVASAGGGGDASAGAGTLLLALAFPLLGGALYFLVRAASLVGADTDEFRRSFWLAALASTMGGFVGALSDSVISTGLGAGVRDLYADQADLSATLEQKSLRVLIGLAVGLAMGFLYLPAVRSSACFFWAHMRGGGGLLGRVAGNFSLFLPMVYPVLFIEPLGARDGYSRAGLERVASFEAARTFVLVSLGFALFGRSRAFAQGHLASVPYRLDADMDGERDGLHARVARKIAAVNFSVAAISFQLLAPAGLSLALALIVQLSSIAVSGGALQWLLPPTLIQGSATAAALIFCAVWLLASLVGMS